MAKKFIDTPILSDIFYIKDDAINVRLSLDTNSIRITKNLIDSNIEPDWEFKLKDTIGCYIEESYLINDPSVSLILNLYPKNESNKRRKISFELIYKKYQEKNKNINVVQKFKNKLDFSLKSVDSRPFLVFLNPNSGSGKAIKLYFNQIVSLWKQANVKFKVIDTLYINHAREFIHQSNLENYRAIIVISGDGLVYEVFNGLLSRPDWSKAIKMPVGQIAAGSANGFSSTIAFINGEEYFYDTIENFATLMSFVYAKSKPVPMDLISIQLANKTFINSFLNIEWAMVADVDYESEQFRFLGGFRFFIGALRRVINLRRYKGRISFLPTDDMKDYKPKDPNIKILKNTRNYSDKKLERERLRNPDLNIEYKHLKPLNQKVPNDWLTIEDSFVMFAIVNLPLMGKDFVISPETKLDDGCMVLTYVKAGIPRLRVLEFFDDAAKGKFLENKFMEFVKIKAFRLEPLDEHGCGNIMIDGEKVHYGAIQGEILPQFARALSMS